MFPWNLFPFNKQTREQFDQMKHMDPNSINEYIQDMMKNMFPNGVEGMMNPNDVVKGSQGLMNGFNMNQKQADKKESTQHHNNSVQVQVFETHEDVYIRLPINGEDWIQSLKIYHTSNKAIIENIPEHGERHEITLPSLVKKKGAQAHVKDGILEVKIPRSTDLQFSEVDVREKL